MSSLAVTKVGGAANNPTSSQEATVGIYSLPEELFVNGIFKYLDGESLAKVSQVCVKMFQMIYNSKFTGGYYSFFVGSKVETKINEFVEKVARMIINVNLTVNDKINLHRLAQWEVEADRMNLQALDASEKLATLVQKKAGRTSAVYFAPYVKVVEGLVADQLKRIHSPQRITLANEMLQKAFIGNMLDAFVGKGLLNITAKDFDDVVKGLSALYGSSNLTDIEAMVLAEMNKTFGPEAVKDRIGTDEFRSTADKQSFRDETIKMFESHGNNLLPALLTKEAPITPRQSGFLEKAVDVFKSVTSFFSK